MSKPFNEFDYSVPAPEFGEGVVIRFLLPDLLKIEKWIDAKLAKVTNEDTVGLLAAMRGWDWFDMIAARQNAGDISAILNYGLKEPDGETPHKVDWDRPPKNFFLGPYWEKISIALVASVQGMTVEEAKIKREEAMARAKEALAKEQNPMIAQGEAS